MKHLKHFMLGSVTSLVVTMFAWAYVLRYTILEAVVVVLENILQDHHGYVRYSGMTRDRKRAQVRKAAKRASAARRATTESQNKVEYHRAK